MITDCYAAGIFTKEAISNDYYKQHAKTIAGVEYVIILNLSINMFCFCNPAADQTGMLFIGDAIIQVSKWFIYFIHTFVSCTILLLILLNDSILCSLSG